MKTPLGKTEAHCNTRIFINAPMQVSWDEKCCPISERDLELYMNVEAFNNPDFTGKFPGRQRKNSLLSLSFEKSKNKS